MGVINATPDSFFGGSRRIEVNAAADAAASMVDAGADIVDIGGESTRPGADPVSEAEEMDRTVPIIERVCELDAVVSIDTCKAGVAAAAIRAGAQFVNDVRAACGDGMLELLAGSDVGVCLMHMRGEPRTMQERPVYGDVVSEVREFLGQRVAACREAGVDTARLVVDPGFGFGKTVSHNLALLANLRALSSIGLPVLVGFSRKSTLGALTGKEVTDRLPASIAAAVLAAVDGASVLRVHDVGETVDALKVVEATLAHVRPHV
ncbi:MAG: dihydropteroate synthase [Gammaproteobacteria bacterium]|nr:dihydropteroate synthase [Gammaproteobacteria bacterium]